MEQLCGRVATTQRGVRQAQCPMPIVKMPPFPVVCKELNGSGADASDAAEADKQL